MTALGERKIHPINKITVKPCIEFLSRATAANRQLIVANNLDLDE